MLIDISASFGGRESIQRLGLVELKRELERTPCTLAFVSANEGEFDQRVANDYLLALCESTENWLPTPTIHPGDTFIWQDELKQWLEAGLRLFRINPVKSGWSVDSILLDLIVDRLAGTGAALLVESSPAGLPSRIAARTSLAGIPVIFTEARYFPLTELIPLAQQYQDIYIETSRLTSPGGIALCVQEVGAHRLLYGSGTARYPAGVAWEMLNRTPISESDRQAIAWRNAVTVLGLAASPLLTNQESAALGVDRFLSQLDESDREILDRTISITRPAAAKSPVGASLQNKALRAVNRLRQSGTESVAGQPSSFPKAIDVHLHDKFAGAPFPPLDACAYEAELARNNIVAGVSSSATAIFHDLRRGNDQNKALLDAVPRIKGYVVVDPRYLEDSMIELDRLADSDRWVGVKIHCAHAKTLTGSVSMTKLMDVIAEQRKPVLIHPLGADWPEALIVHAERHPDLPIIAAHAGYGDAPHPTHDAAIRLASAPNVFLEFCSTYLAPGAIRRGIEAVGIDRVLFGSDFPLISLEYMRVAYDDAELDDEEAIAVYIRNAVRLFPTLRAIVEEDTTVAHK